MPSWNGFICSRGEAGRQLCWDRHMRCCPGMRKLSPLAKAAVEDQLITFCCGYGPASAIHRSSQKFGRNVGYYRAKKTGPLRQNIEDGALRSPRRWETAFGTIWDWHTYYSWVSSWRWATLLTFMIFGPFKCAALSGRVSQSLGAHVAIFVPGFSRVGRASLSPCWRGCFLSGT
ncbi:hypothetical protein GWK47_025957 [Chionoecetes opilio]|uniref:Uncharacterized protein n=1 Tax=Chionoecetes opilio TaxID=41210 RepID=A0A8J8WNK2_CHIOP|nr:hypothetical protein GWK47_025957 [Chionoecetes opilio]